MTVSTDVTLYWPDESVYMDWACPWYCRWFEIGARRLGWRVAIDPELSELSDVERPRYCIAVAEIERKGERTRVYLDWTDWRAHRFDLQKPGELYFAVDLPFAEAGPGRYPIGNPPLPRGINTRPYIAGDGLLDNMYEDYLPRLRAMRKRCIETGKWRHDVIFCGRSGPSEIRGEAAKIIALEGKRRGWNADVRIGAFHGHQATLPAWIPTELYGIVEHWENQAQSKVAVALPGCSQIQHQDWSWRHTEVTGLGCAVVTVDPISIHPGEVPWHYCRRDLTGLADTIQTAMDSDLAATFDRGLAYYADYLSPEANCRYVLARIAESRGQHPCA